MVSPNVSLRLVSGTRSAIEVLQEKLGVEAPWADGKALWAAAWAGTGHVRAWVGLRRDGSIEVSPGRPGLGKRLAKAGFVQVRVDARRVWLLQAPERPAPAPIYDPQKDSDRFEVSLRDGEAGEKLVLLRTSWSDAVRLLATRLAMEPRLRGEIRCLRFGVELGRFVVRLEVSPVAVVSPPEP